MEIIFIGTSTCTPDIGQEVASFVINNRVLVDTGWCNVLKMKEYGMEPRHLEYLILTHLHQDHYLGLPQLLFYLGIGKLEGKHSSEKPFSIIGPALYLKEVVDTAQEFLQISRFPELAVPLNLIPLSPGQSYKNADFRLDTFPAKHISGKNRPEQAFVCKFAEIKTDKFFAFTGDTSFHPSVAGFVKESAVLIHDSCHSSAREAATIAKMANVGKLYLIHYPDKKGKKAQVQAREIFPDTFLARAGARIKI